ncbi:cation:proton antiporter [Oerskovia flava]|uniref:cation:proton antiporter domain-containing protein n=1 Tax=Oerskovia flava TaxID=2986422 RepID=UPI00223EAD40|nr:cation:proton antiporter [Oerskovia sp. JB1-3-2]
MTVTLALFSALLLLFAATARGLGRVSVTAPILFVLAGSLLAIPAGGADTAAAPAVRALAELTLALILFHDAAQVRPRQIAAERGLVARLLLIGLPVTVVAGVLTAQVVLPDLPFVVALLLAASLAPTDAGLGAATVLNPVVPVRVRRLLNVESGLNDGMVTPVVLFAVAAIAGAEGLSTTLTVAQAVLELGIGVAVGVAVGAGGGILLGASRRRDLSSPRSRALGVLAIPGLAYVLAELATGNAFVAAFVAGTAFAAAARWIDDEDSGLELTEMLSEPLGFAVWLAFGFAAVPLVVETAGWREVVYALLSLTVLRMVPVALALLGTGLRAPTVAFVGWFGPRGLASVVFALITVEELELVEPVRQAVATIGLTVLLSVLAHGLSADPLAARYGAWVARVRPTVETVPGTEPTPRGGLHLRRRAS